MKNHEKWMAPLIPAMMPLIALSYQYTRNAESIGAVLFALEGAVMTALSLVGFMLLKRIFKSRSSAMFGIMAAWTFFFAMRSASELSIFQTDGYAGFLIRYLAVWLVVTVAVMFAARRYRGGALYAVLLIFFGVLLAINAVPAAITGLNMARNSSSDTARFKTSFAVEDDLPSPNVYWIHCDGMLGFDAFERYYKDGQDGFLRALSERGFEVDKGAMLETTHQTKVAIPALMCPYFYDNTLSELLKDHESAMANRSSLSKGTLQAARVQNETQLAFEAKGYASQLIGILNPFYPPVTDRFFQTEENGVFLLESDERFKQMYLAVIECGELLSLQTGMPDGAYHRLVMWLSQSGLLGFNIRRLELAHDLPQERLESLAGGLKLQCTTTGFLRAINDSSYMNQPTFNFVFYLGTHAPFSLDQDGNRNTGDKRAVAAYAPQHRYAAKELLVMIDLILKRDADAVIALQADHGLHLNSREEISAAFGEDSVVPMWNQVMSALRVPEKYRTADVAHALSNPLNLSRYLVNTFVGDNYAYLQ